MMKVKLFFTFLSLSFLSCWAQSNKKPQIDSLENLLRTTRNDSVKVHLLNDLCWKYKTEDIEKAIQYGEQSLQLAEQIHYLKGQSNALNDLGIIYKDKSNYPLALDYYLKALKIREDTRDSTGIATSYNNIGNIYYRQGDHQQALEYHFKALGIREKLNDRLGLSKSYNNIGGIYGDQDQYDRALEYHFMALELREQLKDKGGISASYNNIGLIYEKQEKYSIALEYQLKALSLQQELNDKRGVAMSYFSMGNILAKQQQYKEALAYLNLALNVAKEIGRKEGIKEAYAGLYTVFEKMHDYKNAYQFHLLFSQMKDSIFNEESSRQMADMQTKYETEKKEQQIKLLNKDKEIQQAELRMQKIVSRAMMGGLALVLVFSFVLSNRFLLIRRQKKIIETEREKSEKLLLNILPKEIAEELKRNTTSPPAPLLWERGEVSGGTPPLSGEVGRGWLVQPKRYEQVTIMFTDFKGFTSIAEQMSAEELVSELDYVFKKFDEIISKYPIEKIKTIGDAYMCAGGLPVANTTNPMDVVMAALEIREFMASPPAPLLMERGANKSLSFGEACLPDRQGFRERWQVRIGIHTGPVIAGVVGDKKFAYDIWGDTVNIASRMESSGEAGKVNISGDTYQILQNVEFRIKNAELEFQYRGELEAKNKGKIKMYFVQRRNNL